MKILKSGLDGYNRRQLRGNTLLMIGWCLGVLSVVLTAVVIACGGDRKSVV